MDTPSLIDEQHELMQMYKDRKAALKVLLLREGCELKEIMGLTLGQLIDLKCEMGLE